MPNDQVFKREGASAPSVDVVYIMLTYLEVNGIRLDCTNEDIVGIGQGVADGSMDYKALLAWVRDHRV